MIPLFIILLTVTSVGYLLGFWAGTEFVKGKEPPRPLLHVWELRPGQDAWQQTAVPCWCETLNQ